MLLRYWILSLFLCCHSVMILGQSKTVYEVDSTNFPNIYFLNPNRLGYNPGTDHYFLLGDFIGNDTSASSKVPYFYFEFDQSGHPFHYFQDQASFLIGGSRAYGYGFDDLGNLYIGGTSSDNKILSKINPNFGVLWSIKHGHHGFQDICCFNNELYTLGQDEDTTGAHTILLSKFDTSGNNLSNGNFGNSFGFNDASTLHVDSSGVYGFGKGSSAYGFSIMAINTDHDLNYIQHNSLALDGSDLVLEDLKRVSNGWILTGYIKQYKNDSIFLLKLTNDFKQDYCFGYSQDATIPFPLKGNCVEVNASGEIYIGGVVTDSNNLTSPCLIKLDANGNVLWSKNYKNTADGGLESITDIMLFSSDDSLMITGNYRVQNLSGTWNEPKFYIQKIDADSGRLSCAERFNIKKSTLTLLEFDTITSDTYYGTTSSYDFASQLDFMLDKGICYTTPWIDTTSVEKPLESSGTLIYFFENNVTIDYKGDNRSNFQKNTFLQVSVSDILGRSHYSTSTESSNLPFQIPLSHLPSGLYLVTVSGDNGIVQTKKIIISH